MNADFTALTVALMGLFGVALSVPVPYVLTKNKEIRTKAQQRKLERYDELLSRFSKFRNAPADPASLAAFVEPYNQASAYASNDVIDACHTLLTRLVEQAERKRSDPFGIPPIEGQALIDGILSGVRRDGSPDEPDVHFRGFIVPPRAQARTPALLGSTPTLRTNGPRSRPLQAD